MTIVFALLNCLFASEGGNRIHDFIIFPTQHHLPLRSSASAKLGLKPKRYGFAMYVLFYSMFAKVRNHRLVNAYMLGRLIIQNALFVNSIK